MKKLNKMYKYVWNVDTFNQLKPNQYTNVLGLLGFDHLDYDLDRKAQPLAEQKQPSLTEMTQKAIDLLSTNPNGYFLIVEGGRIDHGNLFTFHFPSI